MTNRKNSVEFFVKTQTKVYLWLTELCANVPNVDNIVFGEGVMEEILI